MNILPWSCAPHGMSTDRAADPFYLWEHPCARDAASTGYHSDTRWIRGACTGNDRGSMRRSAHLEIAAECFSYNVGGCCVFGSGAVVEGLAQLWVEPHGERVGGA